MSTEAPTAEEVGAVVELMAGGLLLRHAIAQTFALAADSPTTDALIFRIVVDPAFKKRTLANGLTPGSEMFNVDRRHRLQHAHAAIEMAYRQQDPRALLQAAKDQAEAAGILIPPPEDSKVAEIKSMTEAKQLEMLSGVVNLISDLRRRLGEVSGGAQDAPRLENSGGRSEKSGSGATRPPTEP